MKKKIEWCDEESGGKLSLRCTMRKDHAGDHIATAGGGFIIKRWPRKKSKSS